MHSCFIASECTINIHCRESKRFGALDPIPSTYGLLYVCPVGHQCRFQVEFGVSCQRLPSHWFHLKRKALRFALWRVAISERRGLELAREQGFGGRESKERRHNYVTISNKKDSSCDGLQRNRDQRKAAYKWLCAQ